MILDDLIESRVAVKCTRKSEFDQIDDLLEHCGKRINVPPPVLHSDVDKNPYYIVNRNQVLAAETLQDARNDTSNPYLIELSYAQFMSLYNDENTGSDLNVDLTSVL